MKNTKNPTKTKDRWTPIRNGLLYCAPACGAGCTYAEYQAAVNKAEALKKKCEKEIGGKWEIRVHENLGWHWSVIAPEINVSVDYGGYLGKHGDYYTAAFGGGTPSVVSTHPTTYKTPKEAFDAQINAVKQEADRWNKIVASYDCFLNK